MVSINKCIGIYDTNVLIMTKAVHNCLLYMYDSFSDLLKKRYKYHYTNYNLTPNTFIIAVLFVNYVNYCIQEQVLGTYMG